MSQKLIKENEILLTKEDKNYILTFELQNKSEALLIKVEEEKKNEEVGMIPYNYKKVFTIKEFTQEKEIQINSMELVLRKIITSSKNNKLDFEIEDKKYIKLLYYFFDEEREELSIPAAYKTETFYALSSLFSQNTKLINQFFKNISALQISINRANAFNIKLKNKKNFHKKLLDDQKHKIKKYIKALNEQQNEKISSIEDGLSQIKAKQSSLSSILIDQIILIKENFSSQISSLKSELSHQIATETASIKENFSSQISSLKLELGHQIATETDSIKNALEQQNDQITNQKEDINDSLKPEISSIKNAIEQKSKENSKKISDLKSELNSELITHTSSIKSLFNQQAGENTKKFSYLNSKLITLAISIQQQNEKNDSQIKDLNNKISSIENIIHQESKENIKKISELNSELNVQSTSIKNIQKKNEEITQQISEQISDLDTKIKTQTSSIQNIPQTFRLQREETDKRISEIDKKLTEQKDSIEKIPKIIQSQVNENAEQISNLNDKVDEKLTAQVSSIQKLLQQQIEQSTKVNEEQLEKINLLLFIKLKKIKTERTKKTKCHILKDFLKYNFTRVEKIYISIYTSIKNFLYKPFFYLSRHNTRNTKDSLNVQHSFDETTSKIEFKTKSESKKKIKRSDNNDYSTGTSFALDKLKVIKNIKTEHSKWISSICLLKDKRLVSGGGEGLIIVYNHSYEPQIKIENARDEILSLCVLRNGYLASSSWYSVIKIWKIGEKDYELIHTLKGHNDEVNKVIELEDGRIASCSHDKTIRIWDNNTYQCIKTLTGHTNSVTSIIETNDCIISVSLDKTLRRWNKSSYECIQIIQNVYCSSSNALEKLNIHTVLVGGNNRIFVVDIESSEVKKLKDNTLGDVSCFRVIRNGLVLLGNQKGEICCYNPSSNKIISKPKFHNEVIRCLIETEQNQLISSSADQTINMYKYDGAIL